MDIAISRGGTTPTIMRAAGLTYLLVIALGIAGETVFRGRFIDYQEAAATASAISADPFIYRLGLVAEAALLCADVVVAALLYRLFRSAAPVLSTLAAMLRLAMVAFSAVRLTLLSAPLLLSDPAAFAPGSTGDLQVISLVLLNLQADAYGLALIVFGVCCLATGWMILSSRLAPALVGVGLLIAGVCYLVHSVGGVLNPAWASSLFPFILLPCLVAEGALTLWLLFGRAAAERTAGAQSATS